MSRSVHVVPHTHWDREWYEPFETFRMSLVDLLDGLLASLDASGNADESIERLPHFQLDGQMAVVDDYLEIRPEREAELQRLASEGRLSMGPWYVLPDEFLVSGETLVRNLQLGLRTARKFGSAMQVGYLPDMFGHIAAMPQILSLFGISHAVVWRGVPASVGAPAFWWASPDGSTVRAEYLSDGYGNGHNVPIHPEDLAERIDEFVTRQGSLVGDRVLWMAGMDHEFPAPHLARVVRELDAMPGWSTRIGSLSSYLEAAPVEGLPTHRGEMRSGARANVLMGVLSNHVDVKIAAARAELALERTAEVLDALWSTEPRRLAPFLDLAWRQLILNSAHDSICACSDDRVVSDVLGRYDHAVSICSGVTERALADAAAAMHLPGTYAVNPSAYPRNGLVEIELSDELYSNGAEASPPAAIQILDERPMVEELHRIGASEAPMVISRELFFEHPEVTGVLLDHLPEESMLTATLLEGVASAEGAEEALPVGQAVLELRSLCDEYPDTTVVTLLRHSTPRSRALVMTEVVPPFGWMRLTGPTSSRRVEVRDDDESPVIDNGLVEVTVVTDGTFSIDGVAGYGRLVDDGDSGDSYNWCPVDQDVTVREPTATSIAVEERGPLRARLRVESTYLWPFEVEHLPDGSTRRVGSVPHTVTTIVELRSGEPFVRVRTSLVNQSRDHRLRVHLPLPSPSDHSTAGCAYGNVDRPLVAEGGPNEWGIPTFPSRRFINAGGMTVSHLGLDEYELIDIDQRTGTAGTLALTLLRSTGWLSRPPMKSRPLPAGPELALPAAQVQGALTFDYAILPPSSSDFGLTPDELVDAVWSPLLSVEATGGGDLSESGSRLQLSGATVDAVYRNVDGDLCVRAHEPSGRDGELTVNATGWIVDLTGARVEAFADTVPLRPHQIVTLCLDPPR